MPLNNKAKTRIFYTSLIIFLIAFILYGKLYRHSIATQHKISTCYIDEIKVVGREQYVLVKYHFNVRAKIYKGEASFSQALMSYEKAKLLENKSFPVAYNNKYGYMLSYILIFPDDYKDFNVPFPDSLKWLLPLMEK